MAAKGKPPFDPKLFLGKVGEGRRIEKYAKDKAVFSQGDSADAVFYIQKGKVKLSVNSPQGKEAVVAILEADDFFGEGCLAGQTHRMATVVSMTDLVVSRLERKAIVDVLDREPSFFWIVHRPLIVPYHPCRSRSGGSTIQFERKTARAPASAARQFRDGR